MSRGSAPAWLTQNELGLCPCGCIGRRRRGDFVARTVEGSAAVARQAIYADELASRRGMLQRLDPRTKFVGLVALLVVASLARTLTELAVLYVLTLVVAAGSLLPLGQFIRRVWFFVPVFTAIVVLPATLNLITPGRIVLSLGTWFGHPVGVTAPGLRGAALLVLRVAVSISFVALVTLTTSWPALLQALRSLGIPRLFVSVATMAHRYVFHLLDSVTDLYTARRARTVKPDNARSGPRFVGASAGVLFGKAHHLAGEVHLAMTARGYTGDLRTLDPPAPGRADLLAAIGVAAIVLAALVFGQAIGG